LTTHYIYFSEDDHFIGAGSCDVEKEDLYKEIYNAIQKDTDGASSYLHFGIITSTKTDFLKEAKQHGDVVAYLRGIINQIYNDGDEE
jgi:hypothetical protein